MLQPSLKFWRKFIVFQTDIFEERRTEFRNVCSIGTHTMVSREHSNFYTFRIAESLTDNCLEPTEIILMTAASGVALIWNIFGTQHWSMLVDHNEQQFCKKWSPQLFGAISKISLIFKIEILHWQTKNWKRNPNW